MSKFKKILKNLNSFFGGNDYDKYIRVNETEREFLHIDYHVESINSITIESKVRLDLVAKKLEESNVNLSILEEIKLISVLNQSCIDKLKEVTLSKNRIKIINGIQQ